MNTDEVNPRNIHTTLQGLSVLDNLCQGLCGRELADIPHINIGESGRDYIDYVPGVSLEHPISKSVDIHGRPCLILRVQRDQRPASLVIFRRYTDDEMFCQAGATLPTSMVVFNGTNRTETFEEIRKLILTGRCEYDYGDYKPVWTFG